MNISVRSKAIKNEIIFPGSRNTIFPDNWIRITFQCEFFGKTIFPEYLQKTSYSHVFFWERSPFIFRIKNKMILSGKRNIIFFWHYKKDHIPAQVFWKDCLFRKFGKRKYGFPYSISLTILRFRLKIFQNLTSTIFLHWSLSYAVPRILREVSSPTGVHFFPITLNLGPTVHLKNAFLIFNPASNLFAINGKNVQS